jgi:hypothetical protein
MATQLLVNVLSVGPIAPLGSAVIPHGLKVAGKGVIPRQAYPDRATPLIVTNMDTTNVYIINPAATTESANFRVEYDHSIHAVGATPIKWQGVVGVGAAFASVYGSFSDSTQQAIPASPSTLAVQYDTVELAGGVTVANNGLGKPTRLTVPVDGVYAFDISPQMSHSGGGGESISFWAAINGTKVPRSASVFEMGNNNNATLPFLRLCVSMTAGQYLEWYFTATGGTNIFLQSSAATAVRPAVPSVIANVQRIA